MRSSASGEMGGSSGEKMRYLRQFMILWYVSVDEEGDREVCVCVCVCIRKCVVCVYSVCMCAHVHYPYTHL